MVLTARRGAFFRSGAPARCGVPGLQPWALGWGRLRRTAPSAVEGLADLLPLLFIAAYWLVRQFRGASAKARRGAPPAASPQPSGSETARTPFEELMLQLERALEEPQEKEQTPEPELDAPARPVKRHAERPPAPRAAPRPPRAVPIGFDAPGGDDAIGDYEGFEHERHGFGRENPLSEEVFESRPRFAPRPAGPTPRYDPHELRRAAPAPRRSAVSWADRLRDPAAAREALVLKTIFEGPWRPRSGRPD